MCIAMVDESLPLDLQQFSLKWEGLFTPEVVLAKSGQAFEDTKSFEPVEGHAPPAPPAVRN